jgi:CelD/BcsL family acetyltransferase involved in cellulose biosynthesis
MSIIRHLNNLHFFESEWIYVHQNSSQQSPFASFEYVKKWYEHFVSPKAVRVYRVQSDKETIGFMPLSLRSKFGLRELRNLSRLVDPIPEPPVLQGHERKFQDLLLQMLLETKHDWDIFRYEYAYSFYQPQGFFYEDQLKRSGFRWKKKKGITYTIDLNRTFEDYFYKDLSKKVRKNIKAGKNRLKKCEDYTFLHVVNHEAIKLWPQFLHLEGSGWKGKAGTAIIKQEVTKRFYDYLTFFLASSNNLHLYLLFVKGQPISASFGYADRNVYHWAKIAYDEENGYFSPSNQLLVYMINDIMENYNFKKIHMFPESNGFKHRFSNEQSECIDTIIYSTTIRGIFIYRMTQIVNKVINKNNKLSAYLKRFINIIWFK